jgi:hypothetical protein
MLTGRRPACACRRLQGGDTRWCNLPTSRRHSVRQGRDFLVVHGLKGASRSPVLPTLLGGRYLCPSQGWVRQHIFLWVVLVLYVCCPKALEWHQCRQLRACPLPICRDVKLHIMPGGHSAGPNQHQPSRQRPMCAVHEQHISSSQQQQVGPLHISYGFGVKCCCQDFLEQLCLKMQASVLAAAPPALSVQRGARCRAAATQRACHGEPSTAPNACHNCSRNNLVPPPTMLV